MCVGEPLGVLVGELLGVLVGSTVGSNVGEVVGVTLGEPDGCMDGAIVGSTVGPGLGTIVGEFDGISVGKRLGSKLGAVVGIRLKGGSDGANVSSEGIAMCESQQLFLKAIAQNNTNCEKERTTRQIAVLLADFFGCPFPFPFAFPFPFFFSAPRGWILPYLTLVTFFLFFLCMSSLPPTVLTVFADVFVPGVTLTGGSFPLVGSAFDISASDFVLIPPSLWARTGCWPPSFLVLTSAELPDAKPGFSI
mmetsp:Transcript_8448/g.13707  ORF Transcript_8448/g.13707 Transcript_8448/m.13707 type:complete len:249 (+) Transcript_8448:1407-2153(+)